MRNASAASVHSHQLADGVILVRGGKIASLLHLDIAAAVVGIFKRDLRLVDLF